MAAKSTRERTKFFPLIRGFSGQGAQKKFFCKINRFPGKIFKNLEKILTAYLGVSLFYVHNI
jgi:hypothetical protein